jgi:tRNA(fMet)-specific endonuclease VapC
VAGLVVVDSDLIIDFLRGHGEGAALVRTLLGDQRLRITAVTAFELRVGTDFLKRRDDILSLFRRRTLPLDLRSALRGGEVASTLRRAGREVGLADCLQAGICLRHGLPLATRNRRHFERIDDLELYALASD